MKHILFTLVNIFISTTLFATNIIFNGESLSAYIGQEVEFTQTLYVCGHYNHTLYLSYERVRQPEEVAIYGSAAYDSAMARCENAFLTVYCPNILADTVRTGATIQNLVATVTGERALLINGNCAFGNNQRPTSRPNVGNARLIVCAANLEYYCPEWSGTYGASSDVEFATQHLKTIKALTNIDADIYAFAELQQGSVSLDSLVRGLNASTVPGRYHYVMDDDTVTTTYTKVGFIYRTDKVVPVLNLGHPYGPASNTYQMSSGYHKREYVQCFEELGTQERFVIAMNHFKSKSGGDSTNLFHNEGRMENASRLTNFLESEINNRYYQDEDILIVGDLNCGSMEEPIRYMQANGYSNILMQHAPTEYSYVFDNEVEYLDHVLASTSLAPQITGAAPYHINADESYKHYYTYGDTSMYRYSDHDPIIIGLNLNEDTDNDCYDYEFEERFATSLGSFSTQNVTGDGYWYTYDNYECACANGYYSGQNEDWLISPAFDLSNKSDATIAFEHTMGYGSQSTWGSHCKLWVSDNFERDVRQATWTEISIPQMPSSSWVWNSNSIVLPEEFQHKNNVVVAFQYTVDASDIPSWEIKHFQMRAQCKEDTTGIEHHETNFIHPNIQSARGRIICHLEMPADMAIYDVMGRLISSQHAASEISVNVPAGLYIVRIGKHSQKVIVY